MDGSSVQLLYGKVALVVSTHCLLYGKVACCVSIFGLICGGIAIVRFIFRLIDGGAALPVAGSLVGAWRRSLPCFCFPVDAWREGHRCLNARADPWRSRRPCFGSLFGAWRRHPWQDRFSCRCRAKWGPLFAFSGSSLAKTPVLLPAVRSSPGDMESPGEERKSSVPGTADFITGGTGGPWPSSYLRLHFPVHRWRKRRWGSSPLVSWRAGTPYVVACLFYRTSGNRPVMRRPEERKKSFGLIPETLSV